MRHSVTATLGLTLLFLAARPPTVAADPSVGRRVVLEMIEAINERDLDALDALVASDLRRHSGATAGLVIESLEQFKAFLAEDFATVPDSIQTVHQIFSSGDRVALQATYEGTQRGALGPFPSSDQRFVVPFIGIARIENGKVAELWVEWDNMNSLVQLGHFPPAPCAPEPPGAEPDNETATEGSNGEN